MLVDGGNLLVKHRSDDNDVAWRCRHFQNGCKARALTTPELCSGKFLKRTGIHYHASNIGEVNAKKVMEEGKRMMKTDSGPVSNVVTHVVGKGDNATTARLPAVDNMKRTFRRYRAQHNSLPADPKSANELTIPEEFRHTLKGDPFLFWDSRDDGQSTRTLVFTTSENLEIMASCKMWFADGTFDCVPHVFQQLYTIHGVRDDIQPVPLVFILSTSKSKKVYKDVLMRLKRCEPRLNPKKVMCDFELAFHQEVVDVFPETIVKDCFFHFAQSVWSHIQGTGLQEQYMGMRCEDLSAAYDALMESKFYVNNKELLNPLLDYYEKTWLGEVNRRGVRRPPRFDPSLWNHYDSVKNHEPRATELKIHQQEAGREGPKKRRKNVDYEARLERVVDRYDAGRVVKYSENVAQNVDF
ncbi:uncharacterized protein LOC107042309 [Diachasma alloeum]|uniref:uncharacterized protein LOC107042309 n=1 Tax=Diachasma alloeum TaxID=454923 RepID=UPI0007382E23|nr:uncharacterized protein LOC107042309 [Diachasma alloeum]